MNDIIASRAKVLGIFRSLALDENVPSMSNEALALLTLAVVIHSGEGLEGVGNALLEIRGD